MTQVAVDEREQCHLPFFTTSLTTTGALGRPIRPTDQGSASMRERLFQTFQQWLGFRQPGRPERNQVVKRSKRQETGWPFP